MIENSTEILDIKCDFICPNCGKFLESVFECVSCHTLYCKECAQILEKKNLKCVNQECEEKPLKTIENKGIERYLECGEIKPKCFFCGLEFQNAQLHNNHLLYCKSRYICKECNAKYKEKEEFWEHIKLQHESQMIKLMGEEM